MKKLQLRQWLGIFGFVAVLLLICLTFVFIVPLESYTTSSGYNLCSGSSTILHVKYYGYPAPIKSDYHVLKGELQDYLNAKTYIDAHPSACADPTVKLFL